MKQHRTLFDRAMSRIKNNRVAALVILLGTTVIALATFTDAASNLLALFTSDRPADARAELARLSLEYTADAFVEAAERGDLHAVEQFLTAEMDPSAKDADGRTALMWAVYEGHAPVVQALLKAGAHVSIRDSYRGLTALDRAAAGDDMSILRLLLDAGADVETINQAFGTAAQYGDLERLRILLDNGVDVATAGPEALRRAAGTRVTGTSDDETNEVVRFLLTLGIDPNAEDEDGWTPLQLAAREGHGRVVRTLLGAGADVNAKCECREWMLGGWTALLLAVRANDYDAVDLLLNNGADVSAKENRGNTAMMLARDSAIVQVLRDRGAELE